MLYAGLCLKCKTLEAKEKKKKVPAKSIQERQLIVDLLMIKAIKRLEKAERKEMSGKV